MKKLLLSLCFLASCHKNVQITAPEAHQTFTVEPAGENTVLVWAYGTQGEVDAKEYLCTRTYVCLREDLPVHVYKLTRVRK